ncbi:MAG: hypothetical protein ACUVTX_00215 [Bacteroidales bacterium]
MNKIDSRLKEFSRLLDIMDKLREQCPWDREQTHESLRKLAIPIAIGTNWRCNYLRKR